MEVSNGNGGSMINGMEKLVGNNYKYWRMCMEAYLQGQDLWELVAGTDAIIPIDVPEQAESRRKWKIKCGKALFVLRTSISKEFIEHVRDVSSPREVWKTLEVLFTKKNTARLQFLENELAISRQEGMTISEYFLRVKSICAEISEIDESERISESRLRRYLIRGLKKEYVPFITSIQGWSTQPSVEELENLLSNQEALAKQMAKGFESDAVLFSKGKNYKKASSSKGKEEESSGDRSGNSEKKPFTCFKCGKVGHIRKYCRSKATNANVACSSNDDDDVKWEQCFTINTVEQKKKQWIVDSGCSHHVTGDGTLLSDIRKHNKNRVVITADNSTHPVEKEGNAIIDIANDTIKLEDVYLVPNLTKNLVSVPQITDTGKYVLFGPKDVKVLENVKTIVGDVILKGEKSGSLFVLSAGEAYVKKTSQTDSGAIWHARLGHVGYQMLQKISSHKLVDGIPLLKNVREEVICQGCQYGKSHRLPYKKSTNRRPGLLDLVHTDLMGPTRTPSYSGHCYVMVLIDDHSRYTWVKFLKEKSEALSKFVEFKDAVEAEFGRKVQCLRSDNGGEFMSNDFFTYCKDNGISRQMTCPDTPQQNGVSERKLAHLVSVCLSWLHDKGLPRELWAEAVQCACHVTNRLSSWPGTQKSAFELAYGQKPNVSYFRVFGSICYVHVPKANRTKLDPKARKCIFVGYDSLRKGWRCMDQKTRKFTTSRDVVFDEVSSQFSESSKNGAENDEYKMLFPDFGTQEEGENEGVSPTQGVAPRDDNVQPEVRRSTREKRQPGHLKDYEVGINTCTVSTCFFTGGITEEPTSFEEAKDSPDWRKAMQEEIDALNKNETWELVKKPEACKPVTCKWVFRLKKNSDGTINRFKARLVARGFSQSYGLDYEETFSPVAKMVTVRTIISLAAYKGWKLWQLDVKNAFLYGELDREVFMEQPAGFTSSQFPDYVCRLKKALYGLKQAPRAWYGKVAQYLVFCGFKISDADSSLFVKIESGFHVLVLLYVDDMIITGGNESEISRLSDDLSVRFEMKNLGEIGCFLGLEVDKLENGYFISQRGYARSLLERFNMGESKPMATPMEPNLKMKKDQGKELKDVKKFRQLVGSLIYLTITRPEISYSVGIVSQFMQCPTSVHLDAAKRILRYIKGSVDYGLWYKKCDRFSLNGFVDADWAGDASDRHSTSGYCFNVGSAVISWCSKKQDIVALSSTEAEYVAATMAAQECTWLRRLIGDVLQEVDYVVKLKCDNESAIKLASNPVFHARTKHIEVRHHFIREKVLSEEIELASIRTNDQVADIFTKALVKAKFMGFREALGIIDREFALRGSVKNVSANISGSGRTSLPAGIKTSRAGSQSPGRENNIPGWIV